MRSDDRPRAKSRIVAVALALCVAVLAPATVAFVETGHYILAVALGLFVVSSFALALRVARPRRIRDGD